VSALYAVAFLSSLGFSVVAPFMTPLVARLGGNAFVLGVLGSLFWSAQLVGSAWLGALSDKIGRKRVLFRSQLGALAAWLLFLVALSVAPVELVRAHGHIVGAFALTPPLIMIALARMTDGLFNGSVSVANAYIADIPDKTARERGYARISAASSLGFVVGPTVAGFVARDDAGVRIVVVLALLLSAAAAVLVRTALPALEPRAAAAVEVMRAGGVRAHKALGGGCAEAVQHSRGHAREIIASAGLKRLLAIYFLTYFAFSTFAAAFPSHAIFDLGWSAPRLGAFYTTLALSLASSEGLLLPRVARKLETSRIAAIGAGLLIGAYALMSRSDDRALLLAAVLYGLGNGLMWPSYLVLLAHGSPPKLQGAVQGLGGSTGSLASIVGTLIGGVLYVTEGVAALYVSATTIAVATYLLATQDRGA
jgi:DHA1 family tetracycline resistance protein-like MFS transporter